MYSFEKALSTSNQLIEPLVLDNIKRSATTFRPTGNILFEVAKCGTTSLRYNIWKEFYELGKLSNPPAKKVRNIESNPFQNPDYPELLDSLNNQNAAFTTVVRNPYARVLSCYLDKIVNGAKPKLLLLANLGYESDRYISFKEFVYHISKTSSKDMNKHWMPITALNQPRHIPYAKIGALETIKQDMPEILLFLGHPKPTAQERLARHATSASSKLFQYYDEELIGLVKTRYAEDFEVLGYSTELNDAHEAPTLNTTSLRKVSEGTSPVLLKLLEAKCIFQEARYAQIPRILQPLLENGKAVPIEAAILLSETWIALKDFNAAISVAKAAYQAEPESSLVMKTLATALSANGDHSEASEVALSMIDKFPCRAPLLSLTARIIEKAGHKQQAKKLDEKAEKVSREYSKIRVKPKVAAG